MPHEFTETAGDSQLTATAAPNKVDSVPERQAVTEADLHAEVDSVAGEVVAEAAMRRRTITRCGIAIIALTMVLYFGLFAGLFFPKLQNLETSYALWSEYIPPLYRLQFLLQFYK